MPAPRQIYGETAFIKLKYSAAEAEKIALLLGTTPLLGDAATESAVKKRLSSARVLHLATHGVLHDLAINDSGIVLAPGNGEDGFLTVNEIINSRMNADLVVLSACDTGRGLITSDGVVGLSRALLAAGTRSAIVSLWAVNDASTAELMEEFYRQWQGGRQNKAVAIRAAMLAMKQKYPNNPKHWAAMTLIGELD